MTRIDFKNATLWLLDGYSDDATVDNVSGYAAGTVTMTVADAPAADIPLGAAFMVDGDDRVHLVTARSGGPPNTSITFMPALAKAVLDAAVITFLGRALEVNIGDGNLTYSEKIERVYELNRGRLDSVKNGDEQPVEVTMDFIWEFLTAIAGADTPTIEDVLKRRGAAADWDSSSADPCEPFAVDILVEYIPPCVNAQPELIRLPDFRYEQLDHNFIDAQVSCQGKCNAVEAMITRSATS